MNTTYDPKIHKRSRKGNGYGMKKNSETKSVTPDGYEIAKIFGWKIDKLAKPKKNKRRKKNVA